MTDSVESGNVRRPIFGQGGRLYKDARNQGASASDVREAVEEQRVADMMMPDPPPDPPPWADQPEPPPAPAPMKVGVKEAPKAPEPGRDWREGVSTALELTGIGLLTATAAALFAGALQAASAQWVQTLTQQALDSGFLSRLPPYVSVVFGLAKPE